LPLPFTFNTAANFKIAPSTFCDSLYFGRHMTPVAIKPISNSHYAVLLTNEKIRTYLVLTIVDSTGRITDRLKLENYETPVIDPHAQLMYYEMNNPNYFVRKDSVIRVEQIELYGEVTVIAPRLDTFQFVNGKIIKK
jgi:hypothetical protein